MDAWTTERESRQGASGSRIWFRSKLRGWGEIAGAFATLECALWSSVKAQVAWGLLLLIVVTFATVRGGRTTMEMGLSGPGTRKGWWILSAALLTAALLVTAASRLGTLHYGHSGGRALLGAGLYTVWAFVQEFMAQAFILLRLRQLLSRKWLAVLSTAVVFSVAHIPNLVLIGLTFCGGALLSALFLRYRNLYVLGLTHALLGLALAISMPGWLTHHMKVGLAYFG